MFKWLHKHFIPHRGNDHRPRFLHGPNARRVVLLVLAIELVLFALPSFLFFSGSDFMAAVLPSVLNDLTNDKRVTYNLPHLKENAVLSRAAQMKATDMAARGYFAHNTPEGLPPWHWISQAGYRYSMAGENLAVHFSDSHEVTEAWMNSPTHRDNILKQGFTEIGTGVAVGTYQGQQTIFVVQYYAKPAAAVAAAPLAPASTSPAPGPGSPRPTPNPASGGVAVLGEETAAPAPTPAPEEPRTSAPLERVQTAVERSVSSPRQTANVALLSALTIVAFALLLLVTTRGRRHGDLLTNGMALASIIFAIYLTNSYVFNISPVLPVDASLVLETTF